MKNIVALIGIVFSLLSSNAATWTIHGLKDNYSFVQWTDWSSSLVAQWDWVWDQANPGEADSGVSSDFVNWTGYSDALSIEVPDGWIIYAFAVAGPAPDYSEWSGTSFYSVDTTGNYMPCPGEYWLDFNSAGHFRISTVPPSDFGKWAWDGSINPSWVEPPIATKHGKALGHTK